MKRTFRILVGLLALVLAATLLAGCGANLPDGMDEETLTANAQAVLDAVNAADYAGLAALCPDVGLSEEDWQEALDPYVTAFGAFERYGDVKFVTGNSDDFGEIVSVYQETVYAEQKMVWMVSFTTDNSCVGLRIGSIS